MTGETPRGHFAGPRSGAEVAGSLRIQAAELLRIADELEGGIQPASAPRDRMIDTRVAARIAGKGSSWMYSLARKYPDIGWKLPTGSWQFSERALRDFLAGKHKPSEESEICEVCEGAPLSDDA